MAGSLLVAEQRIGFEHQGLLSQALMHFEIY